MVRRRCVILVLDGVADGPFGMSLDVIGAARRVVAAGLAPGKAMPSAPRVVSLDGKTVRTAAGRVLHVDGALARHAPGRGDVLLLPGLGMATPAEIDRALALPPMIRAAQAVRRAGERGAIVAASCSATFLLASSGLLDGHGATTTWWLGEEFVRRFPRVSLRPERMVVTSGSLITAGSAFAHADLVLAVLSRLHGPTLAALVSRYLVVDERPSQARYMIREHLRSDVPLVRTLEQFVLRHLDEPARIEGLARATGTSPRTLARRVHAALGTTPLRFARRVKIERAVHLLQTTREPVDAIARAVGWADAAAFRRVLRDELGASPRELRRSAS